MILPGKTAMSRGIIRHVHNASIQIQPCGVDLSLRKLFSWTSSGTVDFTNQFRAASRTESLEFTGNDSSSPSSSVKEKKEEKSIHLSAGNYLVEFHEEVEMPLDIMGQIFVRSSLWRMGALLNAGVMDSGYQGAVGGLLQVVNPHGIVLHEHARLAQMVFHVLAEKVEGGGYSGVYQGAKGL